AARQLARLGVRVRTGTMVTDLQPDAVTLRASGREERLPARTVLWAAGVQASALGQALARTAGASLDKAGRVQVLPDLTVPGPSEIFAIRALARCLAAAGNPLPGVAPVAMQQGRYVAQLIQRRLRGETLPPFRYHDKGSLATIGRAAAVADLPWMHV